MLSMPFVSLKGRSGRFLWIAAAGIVILIAVIVAYRWLGVGYQGEEVRIYIPQGATTAQAADTLVRHLGRVYGNKVARLLDDDSAKMPGSYVVTPGTRAFSLAHAINNGRQTPLRFTFNNLRRFDDFADVVARRLPIDRDVFTEAADSFFTSKGYPEEAYPALVIPDTYEVYWTATASELIALLYGEQQKFWTTERLAKAKEMGLSPVDVATIASIAEEECRDDSELPVVARVYLNRLAKGMRLQADPTVKYACGDFAARRINEAMLASPSPYNTYRHDGLPPGPIRIPERSTLQAVLDAPQHPYLYFCASDDFSGRHIFTASYAEHQANARRYQKALNARNIH